VSPSGTVADARRADVSSNWWNGVHGREMVLHEVSGLRLTESMPVGEPVVRAKAIREADGSPVEVLVVTADISRTTAGRLRKECVALQAILTKINPAKVLPLLDHGSDADDHPYLVLPRPGPTLDEVLADTGSLGVDEVAAAARAMAAGLHVLTDHGIVGPPPPLRRANDGAIVLSTPLPTAIVELETTLGEVSPHDPPEVLSGSAWTPSSQVYAFASVLWTLLSGRPPFGTGANRLLTHGTPSMRRTDVPSEVTAILTRALSSDPASRPADLDTLVTAFGTTPQDSQLTMPPPGRQMRLDSDGARRLGSNYLLDEQVGQGGSSQVWSGRDRRTRERVAVKMLRSDLATDPRVISRFLGERTLLKRLSHKNLVRVHDVVAEHDSLGIVMDLVEGSDLRKLLGQSSRLPASEAVGLLVQVADALAYVHDAGVIHRDLKPENVLIKEHDGDRVALISDFGIAREAADLTHTQNIGTPAYMAPELLRGAAPTPAADVYAFGVTGYELLAGRRPFGATSAEELLAARRSQPISRPNGLEDHIWSLLEACLSEQPERRPTAAMCASALRTLHTVDEPVPARSMSMAVLTTGPPLVEVPVKADEPPPRKRRRWPYVLAAAGTIALLGAGLGVYLAISESPDGQQTPPGPPSRLYPVAATVSVDSGSATVRWSAEAAKLPGFQAYFVYRVTAGNGYVVPESGSLSDRDTSLRITELPAGEETCFRVVAYGVTAPPPVPPPPSACVTPTTTSPTRR
jgi:serine/threonine protein kinase